MIKKLTLANNEIYILPCYTDVVVRYVTEESIVFHRFIFETCSTDGWVCTHSFAENIRRSARASLHFLRDDSYRSKRGGAYADPCHSPAARQRIRASGGWIIILVGSRRKSRIAAARFPFRGPRIPEKRFLAS